MDLQAHIESKLKLFVSTNIIRRAKLTVLAGLQDAFTIEFSKVRNYATECLNQNLGSTVVIKTERTVPDSPPYFQRIYFCFGAIKEDFKSRCRKIIGLDGCFLKGIVKGEILTAVGRDANN
ncbi:hypothetical protein DITRI_Ditri01bG0170700 [Diplodiscus trichospermus]